MFKFVTYSYLISISSCVVAWPPPGVYGASVGTAVLDAMGVGSDNLVPRGIAMGASAHSIGTAALMDQEPEVRTAPRKAPFRDVLP